MKNLLNKIESFLNRNTWFFFTLALVSVIFFLALLLSKRVEFIEIVALALIAPSLLMWSNYVLTSRDYPARIFILFITLGAAYLFGFLFILEDGTPYINYRICSNTFFVLAIIHLLFRNKKMKPICEAEKREAEEKERAKKAEAKRLQKENRQKVQNLFQEFFDKYAVVSDSKEVYSLTEYADKIMDLSVLDIPEKIEKTLEDFNNVPVPLKPLFFAVVTQRLTELKECSVEDLFTE